MNEFLVVLVIFVAILHVATSQSYASKSHRKRLSGDYDIDQYANEDSLNADPADNSNEIDQIALYETIPGEPTRDYPTYQAIPRTDFSCKGRVNWGYYADVETECQVFHVCESEYSKISFLCPVGSAFNQRHLVCDWWYNFDCHDEISLTSLFDEYDVGRARGNAADHDDDTDSHGRLRDDDRDNRSLHAAGGEKTVAKRRGGYKDEVDDNINDNDTDGLYDLNLVSSGGNI